MANFALFVTVADLFALQTRFVSLTSYARHTTGRDVDEAAIYKTFGKAIAARRSATGKTQAEIAQRVGLSRASLANIEVGNQRVFLHQILSIADALDLESAHEIVPARAIAHGKGQAVQSVKIVGRSKLSRHQQLQIGQLLGSLRFTSSDSSE